MNTLWSFTLSYWSTCARMLLQGPKIIRDNLDIPLQQAQLRARWFTAWSVMLTGLSLLTAYPRLLLEWLGHPSARAASVPSVSTVPSVALLVGATLLILIVSVPIAYGLFRLHTLVNHIMVINVFKCRGQRLRLLNVETTLLSFAPFFAISLIIRRLSVPLGQMMIVLLGLYLIGLLGYGFNLIFHKKHIQGLWLVIESYVVSWLVLLMGALATSVALGVLAFFFLAFLRLFLHRHATTP